MTSTELVQAFFNDCERLFRRYPAAARNDSIWELDGGSQLVTNMVLSVFEAGERRFFVVQRLADRADGQAVFGRSRYNISAFDWNNFQHGYVAKWRVGAAGICPAFPEANDPVTPADLEAALERLPEYRRILAVAVPLPRPYSYFGYVEDGVVQAIVIAEVRPERPGWTYWLRDGFRRPDWLDPSDLPGTCLDHRFWEQVGQGTVVVLDELIAQAPKSVWEVPTEDGALTSIVVSQKTGPLQPGVFAYPGDRPSGTVEDLLLRASKTDLSPYAQQVLLHEALPVA